MVTFIASRIKRFDGQSNATINFIKGLKMRGVNIRLVTYFIEKDLIEKIRKELDVELHYYREGKETSSSIFAELYFETISKKLFNLIHSNKIADDYYLVVNDIISRIIKYSREKNKFIYWSQGAIASLFLWPLTYTKSPLLRKIASLGMAIINLRYANSVKEYPIVLANSKTTGYVVSTFFDRPPEDVVYPPLDVEKFEKKKNLKINYDDKYILAFLKRGYPTKLDIIKKLSEKIRLKIIGYKIDGVESYVGISDEKLAELYSNALATLYPVASENFGYIPVESMACGTPVIAYRFSGGPAETIIDNLTGWLVNSDKELYVKTIEIFEQGYDEKIRRNAIERAKEFSIDNSTEKLIKYLL